MSSMPDVTHEEARQPEFGPGFFRAFEVTATVYLPRGAELPVYAADWFEMVNRMGSSLERVVEIRYPLCDDIVGQRAKGMQGPVYT